VSDAKQEWKGPFQWRKRFQNALVDILYTLSALMFIYCRYKSVSHIPKVITLHGVRNYFSC